MTHPMSVRFKEAQVPQRLKAEAEASERSVSALAEELIDEGLRMRRHPLVVFRPGPSGRRASLVGGPDVWEVVGGMISGDVAPSRRAQRAADLFGLRPEQVEAALAYYAEYTDEVDAQIEANHSAAADAEKLWRRQRELLAR